MFRTHTIEYYDKCYFHIMFELNRWHSERRCLLHLSIFLISQSLYLLIKLYQLVMYEKKYKLTNKENAVRGK